MEIRDSLRVQNTWAPSEYGRGIYASVHVIVVSPSFDAFRSHAENICNILHLPPFIDEL
jgi:hypothetical protein